MRVRPFVLAVFTLTIVSSARGLASQPANVVSIELDPSGSIVVPGTVTAGPDSAKARSFKFMVDTGANRSAISGRVAARLNLPAVARSEIVTASGTRFNDVVRLPSLSVGTVTVNGLLAVVVPEDELHAIAPSVDGVIGQDFLLGLNYTLDYRHERLVWDDQPPAARAGDVRLALRQDEGRWLVELPQGPAARSVWFVPDSGASTMVVFTRPGEHSLEFTASAGHVGMTTLVGQENAAIRQLSLLRVGGLVLRDQPVIVVERKGADAPAGDGLLPLHLFATVSFNAGGNYMIVRK